MAGNTLNQKVGPTFSSVGSTPGYDQTQDEQDEDATPAVPHGSMKQGKCQRDHNEKRYEKRDGNVVRKDRIHQSQHDIDTNQRPKKRDEAFFHLTFHFLIQAPLAGGLGS